MIAEDCKRQKKDLSIAWIDYKKAYDSVSHNWIIKSLEIMGISNVLGDSLSPILFCIAMAPLTYELNRLNCGYQMKNENVKVSNLLYMDDLKIFGKNEQELRKEVKVIQTYSTDIGTEMGLEKCAKVTFKRGERVKSEGIEVGDSDLIKELGENETYKYLGMNESRGIDETQVKDRLRREYIMRVRKVLKSELNSRDKMLVIGEIAVPVLQYSFGVVNWKIKELENIDSQTRKMLTTYKMHHPKADVDRLYTSRKDGGRGLMQ
ncbi:hypothetical protein ILUMI_14707, partial [Ignelater luminosus]